MKLNEQTNARVYATIERTAETKNLSYDKGLIGPVTKRQTRYVFAVTKKGTFEVGQVDINGTLIDIEGYGAENTRDARIILSAIANI